MTDPRHPLCGRTLPLIGITNKAHLGRCCVVWLREDVERLVPVGATDLEFDARAISPSPLSVAAVERLLQVVETLQQTCLGDPRDAVPSGTHHPGPPVNAAPIAPHQLWAHLTPSQQQQVRQTLRVIGQQLLDRFLNEPAAEESSHDDSFESRSSQGYPVAFGPQGSYLHSSIQPQAGP